MSLTCPDCNSILDNQAGEDCALCAAEKRLETARTALVVAASDHRASANTKEHARKALAHSSAMTLTAVKNAHGRWLGHQIRQAQARTALREAVLQARESHTLQEIGEALGMTRQGVHDLLKARNGRK